MISDDLVFENALKMAYQMENCKERSITIFERLKEKHAFIYLRIPSLSYEYLDYDLEFQADRTKEQYLPVYIGFNDRLLNPRKEDFTKYKVRSRQKERMVLENTSITRKSCIFMVLGSDYLFPVIAEEGLLTVLLYLDYKRDVAYYYQLHRENVFQDFRNDHRETKLSSFLYPTIHDRNFFDQFIYRGFQTKINFESNKIYEIDIKINPNSTLPRGTYNYYDQNTIFTESFLKNENTVPGFTITLKELPSNTKFAFDGKDDVGKTYEQVKKEFILYDKDAETKKE